MRGRLVTVELLERGEWMVHDLPAEIAKEIVRDMVKQMADESLGWFCLGLTVHQLDELAECVKAEMLARERAQNLSQSAKVRILGEL